MHERRFFRELDEILERRQLICCQKKNIEIASKRDFDAKLEQAIKNAIDGNPKGSVNAIFESIRTSSAIKELREDFKHMQEVTLDFINEERQLRKSDVESKLRFFCFRMATGVGIAIIIFATATTAFTLGIPLSFLRIAP